VALLVPDKKLGSCSFNTFLKNPSTQAFYPGPVTPPSGDGSIDFFSFTVWIFYGMSMLALLVLRKSNPNLSRPYKV